MRRDICGRTRRGVVLVAVLVLALIAVFAGLRAAAKLATAETAESESRERLQLAYTEKARVIRVSADAGGARFALTAISNAGSHPSFARTPVEAIAWLPCPIWSRKGPWCRRERSGAHIGDAQMKYSRPVMRREMCWSTAWWMAAWRLNYGGGLGASDAQPIADLTFSPDGSMLAARFDTGAIAAWNLATPAARFHQQREARPNPMRRIFITGLAFSVDSKRLIFGDREEQGRFPSAMWPRAEISSAIQCELGKTYRMRPDLKQGR